MSELMAGSGGLLADDLYASLIELNRAGAISLLKTFVMVKASVPSTEAFWELLQQAVDRLMRPTGGSVEKLSRMTFEEDLKNWYREQLGRGTFLEDPGNAVESTNRIVAGANKRRIQREVYRAIGTSLKLVRYAGLELKEGLTKDGTTQYDRVVPATSIAAVQRGVRDRLEAVKQLVTELRKRDPQIGLGKSISFEVGLVDIVNSLGQETRVSRLRELMNLVEASGFYGLENASDDWVSVVSLKSLTTLPQHEPQLPSAEKSISDNIFRIQATYAEMVTKHELQVLRAQCMVLFAAMPAEDRKPFIDRYFECVTAEELQGLLQDNVGGVPNEVLDNNPMLSNMREDVRRERFAQQLATLNDGQRAVCTASFNKRLLVNAGPGSGKTHVLMMRCAHLIHAQHLNPSEILVLAFNRAVVFEIRERIRDLFSSLGYGSAVRQIDVSTFHSFALRHQQTSDMYEQDAIEETVHWFASAVSGDAELAHRIASGYKAILVDEFQDMNEDFYAVVCSLVTNCQGGAMVIGDDDQDILAWNRKKWRKKHKVQDCPLEAVDYFKDFRKKFSPEEQPLCLNYRSVPEIVDRAKCMIANGSKRLGFSRMKGELNLKADRIESGEVTLPFDDGTLGSTLQEAMDRRTREGKCETVAVLCRTNWECRQVWERLVHKVGIDRDQLNLLGSEDFALYQLRPTGAMMDLCARRSEWDFVEPHTWDDMVREYAQLRHADVAWGVEYLKVLYQLIQLERPRPRIRDVLTFVQEMRSSDIERLKGKKELGAQTAKITIATVHKVKGLEYDTVVVMPSSKKFPRDRIDGKKDTVTVTDAAEEARIYYVGMTRARDRLYLGWATREKAWWDRKSFDGTNQNSAYSFKGSPKEIFVSWPGQSAQVTNGLQRYIETHVNVGDRITLSSKNLYHDRQKVGQLSGKTASAVQNGDGHRRLRVANVIRYTCGKYFEKHHQTFWADLHPTMKQQGWFYAVLVEDNLNHLSGD